ncbi:MAG: HNH endonuclease signature motif containing protein [Gemmatales bacterium]
MRKSLEQLIKDRARHCCEYCLLPDSDEVKAFQIDHIIAEKHRGLTVPENLAYSCPSCNWFKGSNIAGFDPDRADQVPILLFNPRRDVWNEHFVVQGAHIQGKTATGRATVFVLRMNSENPLIIRSSLLEEGLYPPPHYQP